MDGRQFLVAGDAPRRLSRFGAQEIEAGMQPMLAIVAVVLAINGLLGGLTECANLTPDVAVGSYQVIVVATSPNGQTQRIELQLKVVK